MKIKLIILIIFSAITFNAYNQNTDYVPHYTSGNNYKAIDQSKAGGTTKGSYQVSGTGVATCFILIALVL